MIVSLFIENIRTTIFLAKIDKHIYIEQKYIFLKAFYNLC
jgi:hypothetical protein